MTHARTSIDFRTMPKVCELRKGRVAAAFDMLLPGESLEIICDHRPKGLEAHMSECRTGQFHWEETEGGPEMFRVDIRRIGF